MQYGDPELEFHVVGKFIRMPWETIVSLAELVKKQWHKDMWMPQRILALGRGAMTTARLLSNEHTHVYYVGIESYKGEQQHDINCYQDVEGIESSERCLLDDPDTLIVDDLWDTGQTFTYAAERWPKARRAALMSKKEIHGLNYCGLVFPTSAWIVFPWE